MEHLPNNDESQSSTEEENGNQIENDLNGESQLDNLKAGLAKLSEENLGD